MVDEHVASEGREPGIEGSSIGLIAAHRPIQANKNLLGQVLGIARRAGEAIANVVDTPVLLLDKLLPSGSIAGDASSNQGISKRVFFQPV